MKTGTSAIQSFINTNETFLAKNNFFFPKTNKKAMNYLGFSLLDEIPPLIHTKLDINRKKLYKNLINEINNCTQDNILITTEAFSLITTNIFIGEDAPKRLFELFKRQNYTFSIIAFVRRQDEYLETQYNQHIKTHNFWNLYTKDINTFYSEKKELLNFNMILKRWAKYFGENNIKVKVYDKSNNSVLEFLKMLGLNTDNITINNNKVNNKLSYKALEFMRIANEFHLEKKTAKQNYELIELIENALGRTKKSYSLLNREESFHVMEEFKKDNYELSKQYLQDDISWIGIEKQKVIAENDIDDSLTKEDAVKIATKIWNHLQNNKK